MDLKLWGVTLKIGEAPPNTPFRNRRKFPFRDTLFIGFVGVTRPLQLLIPSALQRCTKVPRLQFLLTWWIRFDFSTTEDEKLNLRRSVWRIYFHVRKGDAISVYSSSMSYSVTQHLHFEGHDHWTRGENRKLSGYQRKQARGLTV